MRLGLQFNIGYLLYLRQVSLEVRKVGLNFLFEYLEGNINGKKYIVKKLNKNYV